MPNFAITALSHAGEYVVAHPYQTGFAVVNAVATAVAGPAALVTYPLQAMGFGSSGIIAGSAAAGFQGAWYGAATPAGGVFATLTSIAMTLA